MGAKRFEEMKMEKTVVVKCVHFLLVVYIKSLNINHHQHVLNEFNSALFLLHLVQSKLFQATSQKPRAWNKQQWQGKYKR